MGQNTAFDLDKLFAGSLIRLRAEAEYFSRLTDHDPELGRLNETHLVKLLRAYLPPKIGIGTGFIVSGGDRPQQSPQCDIVLYDALNNAPLYTADAWSIYPIEMVYGVIEVKTTLTKATLKDAFKKCRKIRAMARKKDGTGNKVYARRVKAPPKTAAKYEQCVDELAPRFFVFAYNGWKTSKPLEMNFKELSNREAGTHIHGVCNLHEHGSHFIRHVAFKKKDERFEHYPDDGFRQFLMRLPRSLDSMIPLRRIGLGFDLVDLDHYRLARIPDAPMVVKPER